MKRILSIAASAALAISGLALAAPVASADVTCRGTLSNRSYDDNIQVPSGATCTLNNVTVDGNVEVYSGGSVTITGGRVIGNVQDKDNGARSIVVSGTRVDGDIQAKYTSATVNVSNATVDGNIQVDEARANVSLSGNRVNGDIQVMKNNGGSKSIVNNRIDGNLQCKENSPAPTGSGNVVRGSAEDQCRNLTGGGGGNPSPNPNPVDIYITPGTHNVNGRTWRTSCAPYSQTERCRTEIQATVIQRNGGRYVKVNGWAFNNLTYKKSARSLWTKNPLAAYGKVGGTATWTGDDGRQWRTECDTALTGKNGCRSFAYVTVIEQSGRGYRSVNKWVLNNMVRFS